MSTTKTQAPTSPTTKAVREKHKEFLFPATIGKKEFHDHRQRSSAGARSSDQHHSAISGLFSHQP